MSTTVREKDYWINVLTGDIKNVQERLLIEDLGEDWDNRLKEESLLRYMQEKGLEVQYKSIKQFDKEVEDLYNKMAEIREARRIAFDYITKSLGKAAYGSHNFYNIENSPQVKRVRDNLIKETKNGEKYLQLEELSKRVKRDIMFATSSKSMQAIVEELLNQIKTLTK